MMITLILGMFFLFEYFFQVPAVSALARDLNQWSVVISAAALGLGGANMLRIHGQHIAKRTPGQWYNSAILVVMLALFPIVYLMGAEGVFNWTYATVNQSIGGAIYATSVFYLYSGAYRAFKVTRLSTFILLVSGMFVLLLNAPAGELIWGVTTIGGWIQDIPTTAVFRGLTIGAALGAIALGIRTLLGVERGYLGRD